MVDIKKEKWYCKYCKKEYKSRGVGSHTSSYYHKINKDIYKDRNLERQAEARFKRNYTGDPDKFIKLRNKELKKFDKATEEGYFDDVGSDEEIDFWDYDMYNHIKGRKQINDSLLSVDEK